MSEVRTRTHRWVSKPRLAEVLADLGLLDDDMEPAVRYWITRNTDGLAPGFKEPLRLWLVVLVDGDARSKPRDGAAVYAYFGSIRPFLERWATTYNHLREKSPKPTSTRSFVFDWLATVSALTASEPTGFSTKR
jgi:hypothetical protein